MKAALSAAPIDRIPSATPAKAELRGEIRPKQPCWLTEAVAVSVHRDRGLVKVIADDLGVKDSRVYRVADINTPDDLRAFWIPTICAVTGSFAVLDALEQQVGRVAFVLPPVTPDVEDMRRELAENVTAFGAYLRESGVALADGQLQAYEVKPVLGTIDALIAGLAQYRAAVTALAQKDVA